MDIIELIEDELENLEHFPPRRIPRNRVFKVRVNYFEDLDDQDFFLRFRLSKTATQHVHDLIKNEIKTTTLRNQAMSSEARLLLTLRYLATGSFLSSAADFSGVSPPTASRVVKIVTEAIAKLSRDVIKFPNDLGILQEKFYMLARFPRVVAVMDCTHVNIISPGGDSAENFRNRKSNFSINVQVVCDSQMRCMDIVARWPGSVHDQTIFNNSALKQKFETGHFGNGILLGDSGYETKHYLFTPISNPSTPAENLYNEAQIRTRNVIERCFGVFQNERVSK